MENQIEHHKVKFKDNYLQTKVNVNTQECLKNGQDIKRALFSKPKSRFPCEVKKIKMNRIPSKFRRNKSEKQRAFKSMSTNKMAEIVQKQLQLSSVEKELQSPTVENSPRQVSREPNETMVLEKQALTTKNDYILKGQNQEHRKLISTCENIYSLPKNLQFFDSMNHQSNICSIQNQTSNDQENIINMPSLLANPSQCLTSNKFMTQNNTGSVDQPLHSTPNYHHFHAKDQYGVDFWVNVAKTGEQTVVTHSYTEPASKQLDSNVDHTSKQVEKTCSHPVLIKKSFTEKMSNRGNEHFEYRDNLCYSRPNEDLGGQHYEHFSVKMARPKPSYSPSNKTNCPADLEQNKEMNIAKPLYSQPSLTSSSQFFNPVSTSNIQRKSDNISYSPLNNTNQINGDTYNKSCFPEQFNLQNRVVDTNFLNWVSQDPVSQIVINVNTQKFMENIELFKLLLSKTQVDDGNSQAPLGNQNEREISGTVFKQTDKTNLMERKVLSHANYTTHVSDKQTEDNPLVQDLLGHSLGNKHSTTGQTRSTQHKDQQDTSCLRKLLTCTDDLLDNIPFTSIDKSIGRIKDQSGTSSKSHEVFNHQENCSSFKRCEQEIVHETLQDGYNGQRLNKFIEGETSHQSNDKYEIYIDLCPEDVDTPNTSLDTANYYNYVILPDADDLVSSIDITDDNRAVLSSTNNSDEMMKFEDDIRRNLSLLDTSFSGDSMAVSFASDDTQISSTNTALTDAGNEIPHGIEMKTKENINTHADWRFGSRFKNIYRSTVSSKRLKRKRHHFNRKQRSWSQEHRYRKNGCSMGTQELNTSSSDNISSALEIDSCTTVCENTRKGHPRKAKEKDKHYHLRHRIIQKKHCKCSVHRRNGQGPKALNYKDILSINKRNYDLKKGKLENKFDESVASMSVNEDSQTAVDLRCSSSKPNKSKRQQAKLIEETFTKSKQLGNSNFKDLAGNIKLPFHKKRKSSLNENKGDKLDKLMLYKYNIKTKQNIKGTKDSTDIRQTDGKVVKISLNVRKDSEPTLDDGPTYKSIANKPSEDGEKQSRTLDVCLLCRKSYSRPYIYIHRKRCATAHQRTKVNSSNDLYNRCVRKYPLRKSTSTRVLTNRRVHRNQVQMVEIEEEDPAARSLREHFKKMRPHWKILKCAQCNYMTGFTQTLLSHCRIHSKQDHIKCKHCNISFSSLGRMFQWHRRYKIHHQALEIDELKLCSTKPRMATVKKESKDSTKDIENNVCSFMKDIKSLSTQNCQTVIDKIPEKIGSKILLKGKESSVVYQRQETGEFKKTEQLQDTSNVKCTDFCHKKVDHTKGSVISKENIDSTDKDESPQISKKFFDRQRRNLSNFEEVGVNVAGDKYDIEIGVVVNGEATIAEMHDNGINLPFSNKEDLVELFDSEMDPLDKVMENPNTVDAFLVTSDRNSTQLSEFEECMDGTERHITRSNRSDANQDCNGNDNTLKTRSAASTSTGQTGGNDGDNDDDDNDDKDDNTNTGDGASIRDVQFFSCLVCATSFSKKEDLLRHLSKIHRLTNLCTLCYFKRLEIQRFSNAVSLRNHKLRDHAEDMVECVCGSLFIDEKMLTSHLKKFKCYSRTNSNLEQDMVKCVCGKRFENDDLMQYHKKNKCRKRRFDVNSSDEFDQLRDAKIKYNDNTVGISNFSLKNTKGRKCETLSYADSLIDSHSRDTKFTCENISDEVVRTEVTTDTSNICNENFIQSIAPPTINCEQSMEDVNNNNIDENEVGNKLDVNMNILKDSGKTKLTTEAKEFQTQFEKNTETLVKIGGNDGDAGTMRGNDGNVGKIVESNISVICEERDKAINTSPRVKIIPKAAMKSENHTNKKTRKGGRRSKPDAEGRYPCKICGRRFKRPYLYVHQKQAHQPRQWTWVPKLDSTLKRYKCGLCNLVSIYWRTMVHHHYKKHPDMEFSVFPILPGSTTDSARLKY